MTDPRLSAITATHNDEPYIKEAVESVLNQTYGDFEYVIVDDGSTDRTYEILSSLKDDRIKVIKNKIKQGPAAARNLALEQVHGDIIAIMDGDDISHPDRFEIQMDYLAKHQEVSFLGTGVRKITKEDGSFIGNEIKPLSDGAILWTLLHKSPIIHPTSIISRKAISKFGYYNQHLLRGEDVDLMMKISKISKLANIPEILYTYRVRSGVGLEKMEKFGKPFMQQVYTRHITEYLTEKFNPALVNFVWSVRYPIHDEINESDLDHFLLDGVALLFNLYMEFQKQYKLSNDEFKFIQQDLVIWISKIASKSENYSKLIEFFLRGENLTNLKRNNSLLKAWVKTFHRS